MQKTKAIIICGGEGTRWKKHMGIEKHFAEVDGEPILKRLVRLLQPYDCDIDVIAAEPEYAIEGARRRDPVYNPKTFDADKFLSSMGYWNKEGQTIVFYGDVYFTYDAIDAILEYSGSEPRLFARPFGSKFTGKAYGECFAYSFDHHGQRKFLAALRRVVSLYGRGIIDRCGGWEVYRALTGLSDSIMNRHIVGNDIAIIDDFTEDFDSPEEYTLFCEKYNGAKNSAKKEGFLVLPGTSKKSV